MPKNLESQLIGRTVTFSHTQTEKFQGKVLDKINMLAKAGSNETITGYIIEGEGGKLYSSIAHWRLLSVVEEGKEIPLDQSKLGH